MSYIQNSLSQGEEILLRAHLHWICFIDEFLFSLFTGILVFFYVILEPQMTDPAFKSVALGISVLCVCLALRKWCKILSVDMVITNRRVIYKKGVFAITTSEILTAKIESITMKQSILGNLLGYADIHFSGTGTAHVTFFDVSDAPQIKSEMEYIISQR
ncbi:MAG: PH domain-containing protein [Alphaproteobacteria bacterium]|nr:PH domain-containing protein [Alphaproteobacteria bacterium]